MNKMKIKKKKEEKQQYRVISSMSNIKMVTIRC